MVLETVIWITALNLIILFGLRIVVGRLITKGKLDENKFAIIANGYLSFAFITTSLPISVNNINTNISLVIPLLIYVVYLLMVWSIGYPWFRWVYRRITSRKHS